MEGIIPGLDHVNQYAHYVRYHTGEPPEIITRETVYRTRGSSYRDSSRFSRVMREEVHNGERIPIYRYTHQGFDDGQLSGLADAAAELYPQGVAVWYVGDGEWLLYQKFVPAVGGKHSRWEWEIVEIGAPGCTTS